MALACPSGISSIGVESEYAVATPAKAFSAPGPYCIANTAGRRPFVTRANPSAIPTPTRSCRHITGRIPTEAAASMTDVVGKQLRNSTFSRCKMSMMASTVFIAASTYLNRVTTRAL